MTRRLAEVARKVGVSEATVSRVLNEKPGVSEATRQAVLTALDVLGYERPTKLRGERARLVGLVLPELQNPIFPAFAEVVGGASPSRATRRSSAPRRPAASPRPTTSSCCSSSRSRASSSPAASTPRRTRRHDHYAPAGRAELPTVLVNAADRRPGLPARRRATTRSRSSRRWATSSRSAIRGSGCCWARRSRALEPQARGGPGARDGGRVSRSTAARSSTRSTRSRRPRPAATRLLASGRHRASSAPATRWPSARSGPPAAPGSACPRDVSVVGFDDSALMNCTDPPLTTVRQPIEPMGRMVIELLVGQIAGGAGRPATSSSSSRSSSSAARPGRSRRLSRGRVRPFSGEICRDSRRSSVKFLHCSVVDAATVCRRGTPPPRWSPNDV